MKRVVYMLMALMSALLVSGCGGATGGDKKTGIYIIVNSAESTFRIVTVFANATDDTTTQRTVTGNGIHKGGEQNFLAEKCDKTWEVEVIYNDPDSTRCVQEKKVPCGGNTRFTFNNTTC